MNKTGEKCRGFWQRAAANTFAVLVTLLPGMAQAEGGILDDLRLRGGESRGEIVVLFTVPIQYIRHTPISVGDTILVQLDPLAAGGSADVLTRRDTRKAKRGNPLGLVEVIYDPGGLGRHALELRFNRRIRFEVAQGSGFRSIVVRTSRERKPAAFRPGSRYTVQLYDTPAIARPDDPTLKLDEPLQFFRVFTEKHGDPWERVEVGFFDGPEPALAFKREIASEYPEARVVRIPAGPVADAERLVFTPVPVPQSRLGGGAGQNDAPVASEEIARWLRAAREALTAGDPKGAIPLLTKILTQPENSLSAEAKELLGVARERNGQLAHAKAEYQEYLRRYPDTDDAKRVRQRLDAMLTAAKPGRDRLPESAGGDGGIRWDTFGSVSTFYRYDVRDVDPIGSINTDSSLNNDFFGGVRAQLPTLDLRSEVSLSYTADFLAEGENEQRFRSAFVQLSQREGPLSGHIGRRSANSGGVIERFDGGRIRYELPNEWGIAAIAGLPVNVFTSNKVRTDKKFAGLALDFRGLENAMNGEVFGIAQEAHGYLDRAAIGSELRYFKDGLSVASLVDFDVYYLTLNTAFLTGFWQLNEETHLNLLVDYRTSPILTTSNAIIGLGARDLADLEGNFNQSELKQLAEDRTTTSKLANLGVTHRLSERLQVSSDFSVSSFGSTDDSQLDPDQIDPFDPFALDEILGNGSVGPDYALYTQLIANGLIKQGDVGIVGLRLQKGDPTDFASLILNARYPVVPGLRLNPLLRFDYRSSTGDSESIVIRPTLRLDYKFRRITFDLRGDYLWERNFGADAQGDEQGYTATVGVRYDF